MARPGHIGRLAWGTCLASVVAFGLGGCSSGSSTPDPSVVLYIVVNASTNYVAVGNTLQLTATAYNGNNVVIGGVNFSWSTSDTNIATVDQNGLAAGVAPGTAVITARGGSIIGEMWLPVVRLDGG
jgi:hypothetical protein